MNSDCLVFPFSFLWLQSIACQVHDKCLRETCGESTALPGSSVECLTYSHSAFSNPSAGTCKANRTTNSHVSNTPALSAHYINVDVVLAAPSLCWLRFNGLWPAPTKMRVKSYPKDRTILGQWTHQTHGNRIDRVQFGHLHLQNTASNSLFTIPHPQCTPHVPSQITLNTSCCTFIALPHADMIENKNYSVSTQEGIIDCDTKFSSAIFKSVSFLTSGRNLNVLMGARYSSELDPISKGRNQKDVRDACLAHYTSSVSSAFKKLCEGHGYSDLMLQDSAEVKANIRVVSLHMELTPTDDGSHSAVVSFRVFAHRDMFFKCAKWGMKLDLVLRKFHVQRQSGDISYGSTDLTVSLSRSRIAACAGLTRCGELYFHQNHFSPTSCIRWRDSKTLSLIVVKLGTPILVARMKMLTMQVPKLQKKLERMMHTLGDLRDEYVKAWNASHGETEQLSQWDDSVEEPDNIRVARDANHDIVLRLRLVKRLKENCLAARALIFTKASIEKVDQHATETGAYSKVEFDTTPLYPHTHSLNHTPPCPFAHTLTHTTKYPLFCLFAHTYTHSVHCLGFAPVHTIAQLLEHSQKHAFILSHTHSFAPTPTHTPSHTSSPITHTTSHSLACAHTPPLAFSLSDTYPYPHSHTRPHTLKMRLNVSQPHVVQLLAHSSHPLPSFTPYIHFLLSLLSPNPIMHTSHTLLSYTPLIFSPHPLLSYTPLIPTYTPLIHSPHPLPSSSYALFSCTPRIRSPHPLLLSTPLIHSCHPLLSSTPRNHFPRPLLSFTLLIHSPHIYIQSHKQACAHLVQHVILLFPLHPPKDNFGPDDLGHEAAMAEIPSLVIKESNLPPSHVIASALNLEVGVATYRDPDGTKGKRTSPSYASAAAGGSGGLAPAAGIAPSEVKGIAVYAGPYAAPFVAEFVADTEGECENTFEVPAVFESRDGPAEKMQHCYLYPQNNPHYWLWITKQNVLVEQLGAMGLSLEVTEASSDRKRIIFSTSSGGILAEDVDAVCKTIAEDEGLNVEEMFDIDSIQVGKVNAYCNAVDPAMVSGAALSHGSSDLTSNSVHRPSWLASMTSRRRNARCSWRALAWLSSRSALPQLSWRSGLRTAVRLLLPPSPRSARKSPPAAYRLLRKRPRSSLQPSVSSLMGMSGHLLNLRLRLRSRLFSGVRCRPPRSRPLITLPNLLRLISPPFPRMTKLRMEWTSHRPIRGSRSRVGALPAPFRPLSRPNVPLLLPASRLAALDGLALLETQMVPRKRTRCKGCNPHYPGLTDVRTDGNSEELHVQQAWFYAHRLNITKAIKNMPRLAFSNKSLEKVLAKFSVISCFRVAFTSTTNTTTTTTITTTTTTHCSQKSSNFCTTQTAC